MRRTPPASPSADRIGAYGLVAGVVGTLALLVVAGRVAELKLSPPAPIAARVGGQTADREIPARRGRLLDRRGRALAVSRPATRLFVDPGLIEDPGTFAERVAYPLGYDPVAVSRKVSAAGDSRYVVIDSRISPAQRRRAEALGIPALATQLHMVRRYPHGPLAGPLIGFVGFEGHGLAGLERVLEPVLRAEHGRLAYRRDARGRAVARRSRASRPPRPGRDVRLSVDLVIQQIAADALARVCRRYDAERAELVVMAPDTGEVLAMAERPRFDPGALADSSRLERRNDVVASAFEPGSIFKPFTFAVATAAGVVEPGARIDVTRAGRFVTRVGRVIHDSRGHGVLTWDEVLVHSSNIGMAKIGMRLGAKGLRSGLVDFGFGQRPGSGLPAETPGILRPLASWNHYSVTSVPMGQEVAASPLQILHAMTALAGDGRIVTPTLLRRDAEHPLAEPGRRRAVPAAVARHTRRVLRRVVTAGTGRRAASDLVPIFGKTGTAQIPDPEGGGYLEETYLASFIGGAPVEDPRVLVGCFVHRPDPEKGYYGGVVAAPVVREVIERVFRYRGWVGKPGAALRPAAPIRRESAAR